MNKENKSYEIDPDSPIKILNEPGIIITDAPEESGIDPEVKYILWAFGMLAGMFILITGLILLALYLKKIWEL